MAEKLTNEFTVNKPIDEAWPIITDVERIAPCLPGAQLKEVEGDTYRGVVKVKLGPITTQFKGEANIREQDDTEHRMVIDAAGRDTTGKGNAKAVITAHAESLSPTSTRCVVDTDLHMTGKVAQFGRTGVLTEVSGKLMEQFALNLNTMLDEQDVAPDDGELPAPTGEAVDPPTGGSAPEASEATAEEPTVRKIDGPASEPIDLMEVGGGSLVKRIGPAVAVLAVVLLILRRFRA